VVKEKMAEIRHLVKITQLKCFEYPEQNKKHRGSVICRSEEAMLSEFARIEEGRSSVLGSLFLRTERYWVSEFSSWITLLLIEKRMDVQPPARNHSP
jgi:hypothetical protein